MKAIFRFKAQGPGRGWWGPPKGTHGPRGGPTGKFAVQDMTQEEVLAHNWKYPANGIVKLYHDTRGEPESLLQKGILAGANRDVYATQAPRGSGGSAYRYTVEFEANVGKGEMYPRGGGGMLGQYPDLAYEKPKFNQYRTDRDYFGIWHSVGLDISPDAITAIRDNQTGKMVYQRQ